MRLALAALITLTGCADQPVSADNAGGAALEQAAIATGVIRDPTALAIAGLYARDTDRVCIVADGGGHRIGASVDYGDQRCSAQGKVTRRGEVLQVTFDGVPGCEFAARIDQDRVVFPGQVPAACARLCTSRASLAGLEVDLLSEVAAEAAAMRDARGQRLCGS